MSYSTRNAQSSPVREERRQTNDACYWCRSNIRIINRGTILNESTSGALLRTPQLPNVGETILMLPILWEDTSKPLSYKQIREHPLTRLGSVVRRESTNSVGIRYDDEQEGRPQFRRWFRGEAEITTLFNSEQGMLRMKGVVGIEAAALIQSILRQDIQVKSLIVVATEIENIAPTSVTIIRSALQQCESSGVHVHCVYSGKLSRSGHGLLKHEERSISNSATYTLDTPVGEESTETHIERKPTASDLCVIISESREASKRLESSASRKIEEVESYSSFDDIILSIHENIPRLIIADLEWNNCSDILQLNRLKDFSNTGGVALMILAPEPLEGLLDAALQIPIHSFIGKPYTQQQLSEALEELVETTGGGAT